jgi:DNA-binding transcriptional ArsR family regulator
LIDHDQEKGDTGRVRTPAPALLPILKSRLVGQVLARLTGDPSRAWTAHELADRAGVAYPSVTRELLALEQADLVTNERIGRAKLVKANASSPYFKALAELLALSFGPPFVVQAELAAVSRIEQAFIYGSWAARFAGQPGPVTTSTCSCWVRQTETNSTARCAEQNVGSGERSTQRSGRRSNGARPLMASPGK